MPTTIGVNFAPPFACRGVGLGYAAAFTYQGVLGFDEPVATASFADWLG